MNIQIVDPTGLSDWDARLLAAGKDDFFHSTAWARVLKGCYRYKPVYHVSAENGRLNLAVPLMEIRSVWTGRRGVSLPFTDQCIPYSTDRQVLRNAVGSCIDYGRKAGWKYIELRASEFYGDGTPSWTDYYSHEIALSGSEPALFARLTPSNRRNVAKAVRSGLSIEIGASGDAVNAFCRLNDLTRKRHGLPPQPSRFFEMIFKHVLSTGYGLVFSAKHGGRVVASSVYFHFGKRALYKYGASAQGFHHLRPNNLIMWEALRWYRDHDYEILSLGRTDLDNPGLLRYKRGWGAEERPLKYFRYSYRENAFQAHQRGKEVSRKILSRLPGRILRVMGNLLYRHMG